MIVPVLSRTMVFIFLVFSRIAAFLIRSDMLAPFPVATIIATGVAKPNAQGQAITITVIANLNDNSNSL